MDSREADRITHQGRYRVGDRSFKQTQCYGLSKTLFPAKAASDDSPILGATVGEADRHDDHLQRLEKRRDELVETVPRDADPATWAGAGNAPMDMIQH